MFSVLQYYQFDKKINLNVEWKYFTIPLYQLVMESVLINVLTQKCLL